MEENIGLIILVSIFYLLFLTCSIQAIFEINNDVKNKYTRIFYYIIFLTPLNIPLFIGGFLYGIISDMIKDAKRDANRVSENKKHMNQL